MRQKRHPPVVAGIASIPSRRQSLQLAIESIRHQVDSIEVVLNGYEDVPDWLHADTITVTTSQEVGDHGDNAKFLGMEKYDECVYFAIDDDILYPVDYVNRMMRCMARYGGRAAVGVHGAFVPEHPGTFLQRRVSCFWDGLAFDTPCSYVGTGTIALRREMMPSRPLALFSDTGMSDLFVASCLKAQQMPVICIHRSANWLRKIANPGGVSLWKLAQTDCVRQDRLLARAAPWGTGDLLDRCRGGVLETLSAEVRFALDAAHRIVRGDFISEDLRQELGHRWHSVGGIVRYFAGHDVAPPFIKAAP